MSLLCSTTKQNMSVAWHQHSDALGHNSWSRGGNTLYRKAQKELLKIHVSTTGGFYWQEHYEGHTRLPTTVILTSLEHIWMGLQWCPLG